jgi:cell division initiation protein
MNETGTLTPNDLRNQEFGSKMRGYDPLEVMAVLEEVAAQWEDLMADNLRLREQNESLTGQLKKFSDLEQTLRDTLVLARKAADSEIEAGKKEAALMIEQARMKGESLIREAEDRAEEFRRQIHELQTQRGRLKNEIELLLQSFVEQLERFDSRINLPSYEQPATKDEPVEKSSPIEPPLPAGEPEETESTSYASREEAITVPAEEPPEGPEDRSIDFDAALNRIFGEDRDTPVPPPRKTPFADGQETGEESGIASPSSETRRVEADKRDSESRQEPGADR